MACVIEDIEHRRMSSSQIDGGRVVLGTCFIHLECLGNSSRAVECICAQGVVSCGHIVQGLSQGGECRDVAGSPLGLVVEQHREVELSRRGVTILHQLDECLTEECVLVGDFLVGDFLRLQRLLHPGEYGIVAASVYGLAGDFLIEVHDAHASFLFVGFGVSIVDEAEVVGTEPSGGTHSYGQALLRGQKVDGHFIGILECCFRLGNEAGGIIISEEFYGSVGALVGVARSQG